MKTTPGIKPRSLSALFLLVCILGLSLWAANTFWVSLNREYDIAFQGMVTHEVDVKTYFANQETLVFSPLEGTVRLPEEEGVRVGKGDELAVITPAGVNYAVFGDEVQIQAPSAGLFYSDLDTIEEILTPENLEKMALSSVITETERLYKEYTEKIGADRIEGQVSKNKAIGKIVNNLAPSWAFVRLPSLEGLIKGNRINFKVGEQEYSAQAIKLSTDPKGVVVKFPEYINGSTQDRIQIIQWIKKAPTQGVIVPAKALYTRGEEKGVFVSQKGVLTFKPVKIIDYNQEYACIENIPVGQKIVVNPDQKLEKSVVTGI